MAVGYNPRAVTDGLVLALDAGNPKNYNALVSSTNWTDKVGGNNGTLVGGTYHTDGPFVGAGYVFFDGIYSSPYDYVTTSTSSDFTLGTDDFTIEFFFKSNNSTNRIYSTVIAANIDNANTGFWGLQMNKDSSGTIVWEDRGNTRITATNTNCYNDQWHHLALTREGTSVKLFLDGTQIGSTATYSYTYAGTSVVFGSRRFGSGVWNGNMSNLRIIKGTALYTSNFTPPTKQLTAITNTVLLTCQGNTIADASSGGHTLTANGTAAANLGFPASAFEFDGTNDYVDIGASSDFNFGTGNFTIEGWVNSSTFSTDNGAWRRFFKLDGPSVYNATGQLEFMVENTNGNLYVTGSGLSYTSSASLANGSWNHFAATRIGNTIYLYVNGAAAGSISYTGSFSPNSGSPRPRIGAYTSSAGRFNGKVSALKIYKGKGLTAAEVTQNYNATKGRYA
jgi:hypothetical protein